ncbi:MAG TPA: long-chain fatty acid--CoA ligase [Terriglobales bacterium]|nr:long-chain fatty acid--CoA ligase [Terriglobales bacterium]
MKGTMMQFPLTIAHLLERAGKLFPTVEVVSSRPDNSLHRYTYRELHQRARALAAALQELGLERGDRVATLMWNHHVHLEAYLGVPSVGGVLHTLNLRLHPDELAHIITDAADRWLIVDDVLLPLYEKLRDKVRLERVFVVPFSGNAIPYGFEDYEALLAGSSNPSYPELDENDAAGLCYTSGTTGKPKGVAYSHRAIALHSYSISLPDNFSISRRDCLLPAMSMFHANAWGLPYAAVMNGSKLVLPGPNLQPERLLDLLSAERVTLTGGVPTVWLGVMDALEREHRWQLMPGLRIVVAGSAAPESLFRRFEKFGVFVIQPWGMTETTPIATVCTLKPHMEDWADDRKFQVRACQGLSSPFIEIRAVGDHGEVPRDGETPGELEIRGPFVAGSYYNQPGDPNRWSEDGWLRTGDVVTIDPEGYMKIADRTKDLIKSGGEWISSVDLENALVGHPAVREAAVIAVPHPRWVERPLAVIVLKDGAKVAAAELRQFLAAKFAKWQLPDDFVFVSELPHTSTGKLLKSRLREQYKEWARITAEARGA